MKFFNRFLVFTKRIFAKKAYLLMLLSIIILTGIYTCLPEKSKSSSIRVAVFCEYETDYTEKVFTTLDEINTMYDFYQVYDKNTLFEHIKSGYAHCGFYLPENFFENYIDGITDTPMVMYDTPASTMSSAISETFFSSILKVCAAEILTGVVDMPEYNQELKDSVTSYLYSDKVFNIESLTGGEYIYEDETYRINIPIYEFCLVLIEFSALMGLLMFLQDSERNIYISLSSKETFIIKFTNIITPVLPVMVTGILCLFIISSAHFMLSLLIFSIISVISTLILNLIIRKSTLLLKVLPLIILVMIIVVFVNSLI